MDQFPDNFNPVAFGASRGPIMTLEREMAILRDRVYTTLTYANAKGYPYVNLPLGGALAEAQKRIVAEIVQRFPGKVGHWRRGFGGQHSRVPLESMDLYTSRATYHLLLADDEKAAAQRRDAMGEHPL